MLDVLSVGNANIDLIINSRTLPKEFKPLIMPGGSAANYAVGCARLGLKTGFLGFIGKDWSGKLLIDNFKHESVKPFIRKLNTHTGLSIVFTEKRFKRMYPLRGANEQLKTLNLKLYANKIKHLHLATPPIELLGYMQYFKSVSLDPGSTISQYSFNDLKNYFKHITIFFPNKEEIESICGCDYIKAAQMICDAGSKIVAVKLGPKGCYVKSIEEAFHKKSLNYPVLDTTGAGDAFDSGFTYGYLINESLTKCALIGVISSNICVTKLGAQSSASKDELDAILKKVYN